MRRRCLAPLGAAALFMAGGSAAIAHDGAPEEVHVVGRAQTLLGLTMSASQGVIGADDLAARPILRAGELLEVVPGAAVTQHSGTGKANQYFLRGFNLDHGTDFAGFLDGVPLNQPTHGHGQGYLDLNPIIPELVQHIEYGKGPYYADVGDFSSAGYARYRLRQTVDRPFVSYTGGEYGFHRGVAAASTPLAAGTLLGAIEAQHYDGPWTLDEDADKLNALLRFTGDPARHVPSITLMAYDADWTSTDQIPGRAVRDGRVPRLGAIDTTLGGRSTRYSASATLGGDDDHAYRATVYGVYSDFALYSNFTYLLDNPVSGDQLTQRDRRITVGANADYTVDYAIGRLPASWTMGAQLRHDGIGELALAQSRARRELNTVRDDDVAQTSLGFYLTSDIRLAPLWRTRLGLRADRYWFDVDSHIAANSGETRDFLVSPKFALVFGPWRSLEWFLNAGRGFHSNDARGTVISVDPASGRAARPVDPLVRSTGAETGVRLSRHERYNATLSAWYLELDSELVFVGDAGATEPSGESRRYGIEWTNHYRATDWLTLDLDVAFTQAEFVGVAADEIPNAVGRVISSGATVDLPGGGFGALRLRHFGDVPLVEDGSVEAGSTTVVNLRAGYHFGSRVTVSVDVFNLLDSDDADISYYFASCIDGDPAAVCGAGLAERTGVEDIHSHPVEPRSVRATVSFRF